MSRVGYRVLLVGLALLSLSGILISVYFQWLIQQPPQTVDCVTWAERPFEGRLHLEDCQITPSVGWNQHGTARAVIEGQDTWVTSDPRMLRLGEDTPAGERARRRFAMLHPTMDIVVDARFAHATNAELESGNYSMDLRDPRDTSISIWVGVIPFFFFGLPLVLLVRKQRRWRAFRLAWERKQGIVTEADEPTAF